MSEDALRRKLFRIREIMYGHVAGVIERDAAWEELGLSYDHCQELYDILKDVQPPRHNPNCPYPYSHAPDCDCQGVGGDR